MNLAALVTARDRLLATATEYFIRQADVVGLYLGGSLAAGTADPYSDIDLRVVIETDACRRFVDRRLDIPRAWDGFLFNEWLDGATHCVSHFRPFVKIDIFYLDAAALVPSPWLALPIGILHDPQGIVADVVARSRGLAFVATEAEIDRSLSRGIAALHEAYRRIRRGEFIYAQALLDELRYHMALADDWVQARPPCSVVLTRFEQRASPPVLEAMTASYVPLSGSAALDRALQVLAACYRRIVTAVHDCFRLSRGLARDLEAIDVVLQAL